jgi:hypothetical protein
LSGTRLFETPAARALEQRHRTRDAGIGHDVVQLMPGRHGDAGDLPALFVQRRAVDLLLGRDSDIPVNGHAGAPL